MKKLSLLLLGLIAIFTLSGCGTLQGVAPHERTVDKTPDPIITPDQRAEPRPSHKIKLPPEQDLWRELSNHFYLIPPSSDILEDYIAHYLRHRSYLSKISVRAQPFLYFISQEITARQMPYELALLPIVESGFLPTVRSHMGAKGLWQFMPRTGEMLGLEQTQWYDGRKDIYTSTHAALKYLQSRYKKNNNDWLLALASYNAGYGNVVRAKNRFLKNNPNGVINFWNIRRYLPKETQHYVPRLLAVAYLIKNREKYNLNIPPIDNAPYFKQITLNQQIDLSKAMLHSNISKQHFKLLNPAYLKRTTPPNGPHTIILPIKEAKLFKQALKNSPNLLSVNWLEHKIRAGESLSVIAQKYQTSSREIKRLNNMRTDRLRAGRTLLIPVTKHSKQSPNLIRVTSVEHKIKAGESLSVIAQKHQTSSRDIKRLNNMTTDRLRAGKTLLIPINKPLSSHSSKSNQPKIHTHTVRPNESLWSIARIYNTSVRHISKWNNLNTKNALKKGQKLNIHLTQNRKKITHTLRKGESLWSLAQRYNTSVQQIARWNHIKQSITLHPGKQLKIWISG